jgi:hypothetical protein
MVVGTFAGYPTFCSWEHAAEWFARPRPDFEAWDKSPDADDGFQYWGLIVVVVVLGLSLYGLGSLVAKML